MVQTKRNRAIAMLLFLVMVTSIFASDTLARFTTSVTSSDSSRIAYWGINEGPVTMDLFDGEYFYNDDENGIVLARSHDGDNIIAPGFGKQSEFGILVHESTIAPEVAYELKITLDDSEIDELIKDNTSIQWKLNNGAWGTFDQLKSSLLALSGDPSGYKIYQPGELIQNFRQGEINTIAWQWIDDSANDAADTELTEYVDFDKANVKLEVTISAVQYLGTSSMLNATSTFNINDENAVLSFRSAAPVTELQEVKVNGNVVAPENYDVIEGSTIIKFKDSYVRSLSKGNHVIEIVSQNMTAKTNFKIVEEYVPIIHNDIIPEGGVYVSAFDGRTYVAGNEFPEYHSGDTYTYGDYIYIGWGSGNEEDYYNGVWDVDTIDKNKTKYGKILSNINGENVVRMFRTFSNCSDLVESPLIPNTIEVMAATFEECVNLKTPPVLPNSIKELDTTFFGCTSLEETPVFPEGLSYIANAFMDCSSLKTVHKLPESITYMFCAFCGCTSLENAPAIPKNVTNIGGAFANCTSLRKAPIIPSSVETMDHAFHDCVNLTGIIEINANPYDYSQSLFNTQITDIIGDCPDEKKREIAIDSYLSFVNNGPIPEGGTYYVFRGEPNEIKLEYGDNFPARIQPGDVYVYGDYEYVFDVKHNESGEWEFDYEQDGWGVKVLDKNKSSYGEILTNIVGKNIVNIDYLFDNCSNLITSPEIPETVISMNWTFRNCTSLKNGPELPNGLTEMLLTFFNCTSLETVSAIPNGVTTLDSTFYNCSSLIEAPQIPNSVVNMDYAFSACSSLTEMPELPDGIMDLGNAFSNCSNLKTASVIPSSVTNMGMIFSGCKELTGTIEINTNPIYYGDAFAGTEKQIILTGTSTMLQNLAETSVRYGSNGPEPVGNVIVGN